MTTSSPGRMALLAAATALLLPLPLAAQDYRVEVIVFTQSPISDDNPEQWPRQPEPLGFPAYADLDAAIEAPTTTAFRRVPGEELDLGGVARRLEQSGGYTVRAHLSWIQPGDDRATAAAVTLPVGEDLAAVGAQEQAQQALDDGDQDDDNADAMIPSGLSGALRVWQGRYLHLDAKLHWRESDGEPGGDSEASDDSGIVTMDQTRRMRTDDVHYLDHPRLGVVARVTEVEETSGSD